MYVYVPHLIFITNIEWLSVIKIVFFKYQLLLFSARLTGPAKAIFNNSGNMNKATLYRVMEIKCVSSNSANSDPILFEFTKILLKFETTCFLEDPSETDMPHRRQTCLIGNRHISAETHQRPTCLVRDRHASPETHKK